MSLTDLQQMGNQASPYGGVALGHAPQQPNMGLGPNRYIPPTFNYGSNGQGSRPNYTQMDWNQMQASYLPRTTNQGETANTYMQQLQQMLGGFSQQYGGPNRRPTMPNFSSYNPGFGGATSYYDQQPQGPQGGGQQGYEYMSPEARAYMQDQQSWSPERIQQEWDSVGPNSMIGFGSGRLGGGMDINLDARIGPDGRVYGRNSNNEWGPETGGRGGYGGGGRRGGMGQMPQFNPYMLMQNGLRGMDFNEMFDPRFAALFGGNRFGSRTPNSQQNATPQYIKPQSQFIDGEYASGGKPGGV